MAEEACQTCFKYDVAFFYSKYESPEDEAAVEDLVTFTKKSCQEKELTTYDEHEDSTLGESVLRAGIEEPLKGKCIIAFLTSTSLKRRKEAFSRQTLHLKSIKERGYGVVLITIGHVDVPLEFELYQSVNLQRNKRNWGDVTRKINKLLESLKPSKTNSSEDESEVIYRRQRSNAGGSPAPGMWGEVDFSLEVDSPGEVPRSPSRTPGPPSTGVRTLPERPVVRVPPFNSPPAPSPDTAGPFGLEDRDLDEDGPPGSDVTARQPEGGEEETQRKTAFSPERQPPGQGNVSGQDSVPGQRRQSQVGEENEEKLSLWQSLGRFFDFMDG